MKPLFYLFIAACMVVLACMVLSVRIGEYATSTSPGLYWTFFIALLIVEIIGVYALRAKVLLRKNVFFND